MTNSTWQSIKFKVFKSGNPVFQYIGINVALFVFVSFLAVLALLIGYKGVVSSFINSYLAFPSMPEKWLTHFYTLITYQFLHRDVFHVLFNMLWLYWMGQLFLSYVKPLQFHVVYLGGGVFGAILYALMYNLIPAFKDAVPSSTLIGASAAVMAIFAAVTTLIPNYTLRLLLIGNIKLKYLLLIYIVLDIIAMQSYNAGGSISHLGGALFGFIYVKLLQNGTDLSKLFKAKPKLKVVVNEQAKQPTNQKVNQDQIDAILDKISKHGYDKLTKEEKEILFRASNN